MTGTRITTVCGMCHIKDDSKRASERRNFFEKKLYRTEQFYDEEEFFDLGFGDKEKEICFFNPNLTPQERQQ